MIGDLLLQRLDDLQGPLPAARYLVGFSGGLDSTVLLHALWRNREHHRTPVVAVHINHQLHERAAEWDAHCRRFADDLEVPYYSRTVTVTAGSAGLEAAAREARYAALNELVQPGDTVLSAHHEEDQAETLLLNLLRGSGPAGLAGIGAKQPFGHGQLIRPMLGVPRQEIAAYATAHGLVWMDDPSNSDLRFDRNFLRQEILPRLQERWPAASASIRRSAELQAETAALLTDLAALDLAALGGEPRRLAIAGLVPLSRGRQRNLLKHAIRQCGLPAAPSTRLRQAVDELIPAAEDAQPEVHWPGAVLRRYRGTVYLLPEHAFDPLPPPLTLASNSRVVRLGEMLGTLELEAHTDGGIDPELVASGLTVRFRAGGEKIRVAGRSHRQSLKNLLQEAAVVPWMRQHVPLLYANDRLVAVADLWIAQEAWRAQGYAVRWKSKPAIF